MSETQGDAEPATRAFLKTLRADASRRFWAGGRFAFFHAWGKLGGDPIFRELLRRGLLPSGARLLDLGCGQGCLFAWLLAAQSLSERGQWLPDWPPAPSFQYLRGVELLPRDVERAAATFGGHPLVQVEQGDMTQVDIGSVDAVTILDALHYVDHAAQERLLQRIRAALPPGGLFLTRVGDASAGWSFRMSNWVDRAVTLARSHQPPHLFCRSLGEWQALLTGLGFEVDTEPMSEGKTFANVMLVCRAPA
ncbi:methyltransferase domain-containing protein [Hydrogenophaga sp. A37]|uniref:class I SAM-dependent methyltransferase n=1 Tax=Hydrogenophaga sp. A37 TaxID=1945864 RepID=UPI0009841D16|nr:class I SAM-dependent methyltransferase [Hydrogenophaga sp. A37]OOG79405.1 methyltransferase type 11 [Hydrogenophaga sp. A37]